ncbi:zonular occludens toxin domain-containing protein [Pseudomonas tohonis]|uniref:zonular occludens toxin domain-containing protein n=1 Tax=Pseudomonas tohonis TaxID=2725477 RepID=UPI00255BAA64|nr:zonular occludens toxin domain-containing protein [Pseudomonas tohonis]
MALNLYSGQPGAGKSYSVVAHVIIPALKKGRHVVTNIPLEDELLIEVFGGRITQLQDDDLLDPELPEHIPNGCVAIIDECWERWPSGQRLSKAPPGDLHWLKKHRHRVDAEGNAMQVVLCSQNPADLAKWVRDLIRHTFFMNKLEDVGAENKFSIKIYKGCPTGENPPARYLIRTAYGNYDPDIYQYYKSATQSESNDVGDEVAMDKRTSIWSSPTIWLQLIGAPVVFAIAVGVLVWVGNKAMSDDEGEGDSSQAAAVEPSPTLVNPPPPGMLPEASPAPPVAVSEVPAASRNPAPQELAPSIVWRFAGTAMKGDPRAPGDNQATWGSVSGYGDLPEGTRLRDVEPMALLVSMGGMRRVPLSLCRPYPDGINYYCDVDGERVTPWSGRMGLTDTVPSSAAAGVRSVATERSEQATSGSTAPRSAELPRQSVTVVSDNSRTPRTLLESR